MVAKSFIFLKRHALILERQPSRITQAILNKQQGTGQSAHCQSTTKTEEFFQLVVKIA